MNQVESRILDWRTGRPFNIEGKKKIILGAGMGTSSGNASRMFLGFIGHAIDKYGYKGGDFTEISYNGFEGKFNHYQPLIYKASDTEGKLENSAEHFVNHLKYFDQVFPEGIKFDLLGHSMSGVPFLEATDQLLKERPWHWADRINSLTTLSSPHFGIDLTSDGSLVETFLSLASDILIADSPALRDLRSNALNSYHRDNVFKKAEFIKNCGVKLLTLGVFEDGIMTEKEAIIATEEERPNFIIKAYGMGRHAEPLNSTQAWERIMQNIGPQEMR